MARRPCSNLVLLVCATACLAGCSIFGTTPDRFDIALARQDEGNLPAAIENYRQHLHGHPEDAIAWFNLGVALQDNRQADEATDAYLKALQLRPEDARAMVNLATVLDGQRRHDEARRWLDKACAAESSRAFPWFSLGLHLQRGLERTRMALDVATPRRDEAEQAFLRALEREPKHFLANLRFADFLMLTKRAQSALKHYAAALDAQPQDVATLIAASRCAREAGDDVRAIGWLGDVAVLEPTNWPARAMLAETLVGTGKHRDALPHLWELRSSGTSEVDQKLVSRLIRQCLTELLSQEVTR